MMFAGEMTCLIYFFLVEKKLAGEFQVEGGSGSRSWFLFMIPAAFDVLGTGVGGVGMIYISSSIWQMMRGSIIVFTSLFSVFFLDRKLYAYHWVAVLVTVIGLSFVGLSAVLDQKATSHQSAFSELRMHIEDLTAMPVENLMSREFSEAGQLTSFDQSITNLYSVDSQAASSFEKLDTESLQTEQRRGREIVGAALRFYSPSEEDFQISWRSVLTLLERSLPTAGVPMKPGQGLASIVNVDITRRQTTPNREETILERLRRKSDAEQRTRESATAATPASVHESGDESDRKARWEIACLANLHEKIQSVKEDDNKAQSKMALGIGLTILSQIFAAGQMVMEEKYVANFFPSHVVGAEGLFGLLYMMVLLPIFYFIPGA